MSGLAVGAEAFGFAIAEFPETLRPPGIPSTLQAKVVR